MLPRLGAHVRPSGGADFLVWAPGRTRASVELDPPAASRPGGVAPPAGATRVGGRDEAVGDRRRANSLDMAPAPEGLWRLEAAEATTGARYTYWLDDEGPFPDPYARSLPEGPHGSAELVDPTSFRWTDQTWSGLTLDSLVVYELHVGTFSPAGTFDGVTKKLPYLRELGVTAIELMPISTFPGRHNWGYDGVDHYAPAAVYGGPEGLRRLIDAAHGHGLGVIVDVVYNHLGPSGNYLGTFSPAYFTDRIQTPWGAALDYSRPSVRAWAIENAIHFLTEYHADGLRLDAIHEIHDPTLVPELAARCRAEVARPIVLIAEDERPSLVRGLDARWADDFHHAVRTMLTPERHGYYARYAGTAAELARFVTAGSPASVFCIENHDQVGNRAHGERFCHLVSPSLYRAASALLLLLPATPMLFMGQEFAASTPFLYFTDHDADLGRQVTAGRRREFEAFGWDEVADPQAPETFERSRLDWRDAEMHADVLTLYRDLLRVRRTLAVGSARAQPVGERAIAVQLAGGKRLVTNFGPTVTVPMTASYRATFTTAGEPVIVDGQAQMPAESTALFEPA
jgi:maltooligosyltrehalose trehalohydrolase